MGPTGWAVVAALASLSIGAMNLWILRAIEAGSLRRNQFVGIRTARTMRDDQSWQIAHDVSIPSCRWSIALAVATAVVVLVLREPIMSSLGLLVPVAPMVVGGVQGQAAARRHQQGSARRGTLGAVHPGGSMKAVIGSTVVAEAANEDLVKIEGNWYFPPSSLTEGAFTKSPTQYHCPWKGDTQYWNVGMGDDVLPDGGWSYPEPIPSSFDRVGQDYSGYVAFDRKVTVSE